MRLVAGGDSFVWGSELSDHKHGGPFGYSLSTYPALLAKAYGLKYECSAYPGIGNKEISARIKSSAVPGDLVIVSWTWQSRDNAIDSNDVIIDLQNYLGDKNISFLFTCVDNCILTENKEIDYKNWWLFPAGDHRGKTMSSRGFYQWAIEEGYQCGPQNHPLELAHIDAANMLSDRFLTLIEKI